MRQIVIFVFVIVLGACNNSQTNTNNSIASAPSKNINTTNFKENDFQVFWNAFRNAILQKDTLRLIELTNFPLKSHGMLDEDPQILITKEDFFYYFNKCLNASTEITLDKETSLDYIKRTTIVKDDRYCTIQDEWCRISNFEFEKIGNVWKLTLLYFDTSGKYL